MVTAVAPVVIKGNGLWVGWPGLHLPSNFDDADIPESDPSDNTPTAGLKSAQVKNVAQHIMKIIIIMLMCVQVVTVNCDPDLFEMYYNGCCNGTHWPLFHSMPGKC